MERQVTGASMGYKLLTDGTMWFEIFLLSLMPYSTANKYIPGTFYMKTVDWVNPSGDPLPGSYIFETEYQTADIMLSLMVFRLYFLIEAALVMSPIERLNSRRICFQRGIDYNFLFKVRSNLMGYPLQSMFFLIFLSITFFSLLLMIYERPYWTQDLGTNYMQFSSFSAAAWYAIITMTTVGYGDVVASTSMGRFVAIMTIMAGAYIMSIVIAVQSSFFELSRDGKIAIKDVTE
jgi:hypothetical protein